MQIHGSPVLNPLSSLVILVSVGNQGYCIIGWPEKPTGEREKLILVEFFQHKSGTWEKGQFWQDIIENQVIEICH